MQKTKKSAAIFVAICLIFSGHLPVYGQSSHAFSLFQKSPSSLAKLSLPDSFGRIERLNIATGPTLFHIQTAHGHHEAQTSIYKILDHLNKTYELDAVFIEGNDGKLFPSILKLFPQNMEKTMKAANLLAKYGFIEGEEIFLIENSDIPAYGIENPVAYSQNEKAFVEVIQQKRIAHKFLQKMDRAIESLSSHYLNNTLRQFIRQKNTFENRAESFESWIHFLTRLAKEKGIDFTDPYAQEKWPMLVRFRKIQEIEKKFNTAYFQKEKEQLLGRIRAIFDLKNSQQNMVYKLLKKMLHGGDFAKEISSENLDKLMQLLIVFSDGKIKFESYEYVNSYLSSHLLQKELHISKLFEEAEALEEILSKKITVHSTEEKILELIQSYWLLKKLFDLQLTPREYQKILERESRLKPSVISKGFEIINQQNRVKNVSFEGMRSLDLLYQRALEFYKWAKKRDEIMIQKTHQQIQNFNIKKAAVITGGFHADPFHQYFSKEKYNYALLSPKMTEISENGQEEYIKSIFNQVMLEKKAKHSTMKAKALFKQALVNPEAIPFTIQQLEGLAQRTVDRAEQSFLLDMADQLRFIQQSLFDRQISLSELLAELESSSQPIVTVTGNLGATINQRIPSERLLPIEEESIATYSETRKTYVLNIALAAMMAFSGQVIAQGVKQGGGNGDLVADLTNPAKANYVDAPILLQQAKQYNGQYLSQLIKLFLNMPQPDDEESFNFYGRFAVDLSELISIHQGNITREELVNFANKLAENFGKKRGQRTQDLQQALMVQKEKALIVLASNFPTDEDLKNIFNGLLAENSNEAAHVLGAYGLGYIGDEDSLGELLSRLRQYAGGDSGARILPALNAGIIGILNRLPESEKVLSEGSLANDLVSAISRMGNQGGDSTNGRMVSIMTHDLAPFLKNNAVAEAFRKGLLNHRSDVVSLAAYESIRFRVMSLHAEEGKAELESLLAFIQSVKPKKGFETIAHALILIELKNKGEIGSAPRVSEEDKARLFIKELSFVYDPAQVLERLAAINPFIQSMTDYRKLKIGREVSKGLARDLQILLSKQTALRAQEQIVNFIGNFMRLAGDKADETKILSTALESRKQALMRKGRANLSQTENAILIAILTVEGEAAKGAISFRGVSFDPTTMIVSNNSGQPQGNIESPGLSMNPLILKHLNYLKGFTVGDNRERALEEAKRIQDSIRFLNSVHESFPNEAALFVEVLTHLLDNGYGGIDTRELIAVVFSGSSESAPMISAVISEQLLYENAIAALRKQAEKNKSSSKPYIKKHGEKLEDALKLIEALDQSSPKQNGKGLGILLSLAEKEVEASTGSFTFDEIFTQLVGVYSSSLATAEQKSQVVSILESLANSDGKIGTEEDVQIYKTLGKWYQALQNGDSLKEFIKDVALRISGKSKGTASIIIGEEEAQLIAELTGQNLLYEVKNDGPFTFIKVAGIFVDGGVIPVTMSESRFAEDLVIITEGIIPVSLTQYTNLILVTAGFKKSEERTSFGEFQNFLAGKGVEISSEESSQIYNWFRAAGLSPGGDIARPIRYDLTNVFKQGAGRENILDVVDGILYSFTQDPSRHFQVIIEEDSENIFRTLLDQRASERGLLARGSFPMEGRNLEINPSFGADRPAVIIMAEGKASSGVQVFIVNVDHSGREIIIGRDQGGISAGTPILGASSVLEEQLPDIVRQRDGKYYFLSADIARAFDVASIFFDIETTQRLAQAA